MSFRPTQTLETYLEFTQADYTVLNMQKMDDRMVLDFLEALKLETIGTGHLDKTLNPSTVQLRQRALVEGCRLGADLRLRPSPEKPGVYDMTYSETVSLDPVYCGDIAAVFFEYLEPNRGEGLGYMEGKNFTDLVAYAQTEISISELQPVIEVSPLLKEAVDRINGIMASAILTYGLIKEREYALEQWVRENQEASRRATL